MAAQLLFAKEELAVQLDLIYPSFGGNELPRLNAALKFGQEFFRHPDGARGLVSFRAVFDFNVPHDILRCVILSCRNYTSFRDDAGQGQRIKKGTDKRFDSLV